MNQAFVSILACPACKSNLTLEATASPGHAIETGTLACTNKHTYPIVRGIPRFVESDGYAANFGFEWNIHNKTQLDSDKSRESEDTFTEKTGFTPEQLQGKLVLDVGCGMGRFSDVVSRWGGTVVGIDLTSAVDAAYGNLKDRDNVHLAQANVFDLPFRDGTFDAIFSIGVLHHTPDTKAAFDRLPRLLRPGGTIAIWVYSTSLGAWTRVSDVYRHVTTRMPKRLLYALSHVAVPLHRWNRYYLVRAVSTKLLPISGHPDPAWRVLDTFDWYSPTYQWKHSETEVRGWFESHGLVSVLPLGHPTSMRGMRPDRSKPPPSAAVEIPVGESSR
jgi:ubiquinone/menaquinone biosynthesis C-methylase UbiE/uncharacterized protein YbaR (Trm112 family)